MIETKSGSVDIDPQDEYEIGECPENAKLTPEQELAIKRSLSLVERLKPQGTAAPVIKLSLYNFLSKNPYASDEEILAKVSLCNRFSKLEQRDSDAANPLPTIGIEVEIPDVYFPMNQVAVLDALEIPSEPETNPLSKYDLWEVSPGFSYNAFTQGQYLQELAELGVIPLGSEDGDGLGRVSEVLSLHVNFGLPDGLDKADFIKNYHFLYLFSDVVTYAYTTAQRIRERKTRFSIKIKNDAKMNNKSSQIYDITRLELRAGEFKDFPTFRMLTESQRVAAALFAFLKDQNNLGLTKKETDLVEIGRAFILESSKLIERFAGSERVNLADTNKEEAASLIQNSNIQARSRAILTKYSHLVAKVISGDVSVYGGES